MKINCIYAIYFNLFIIDLIIFIFTALITPDATRAALGKGMKHSFFVLWLLDAIILRYKDEMWFL